MAVALLLALLARLYLPWLGHSFPLQKQLLTREFLYFLAPWLVLSGLATFMACVLNAIEKFAVPALVPILTPAAVLFCIAVWTRASSGFALALGTVAGSFLEAALLYYLVKKHQILGALRWHGFDPRVRAVLSQTGPMMAGCLLMGATPVVDQFMAAMLGSGNVSALSYGSKVPAALLAIGATALSTATLPYFSRMAADSDWQGCRHTLKRYSALMLSVSIPAHGRADRIFQAAGKVAFPTWRLYQPGYWRRQPGASVLQPPDSFLCALHVVRAVYLLGPAQ